MSLMNNIKAVIAPFPRVDPGECIPRIRQGGAVLVDVREPPEWQGGVAKGALLLPLSDLMGPRERWRGALARLPGRELILYCAMGRRAGMAARVLSTEGVRAVNAGGLTDWAAAGWEVGHGAE